jgi:hypothetical protein
MIQELKELTRLQASRKLISARHNVFAASFKGLDSKGNPVPPQDYVCGGTHFYAKYYYLIP